MLRRGSSRCISCKRNSILLGNRFSFFEEETTAFRVRFLLFEHHLFPRTPFIPCGFVVTVTYRMPLVLKGRSLYPYWSIQIIFVCSVFLSLSVRQVGRKLGVFLDPSRVGLRSKAQDDEGVLPPSLDSFRARQDDPSAAPPPSPFYPSDVFPFHSGDLHSACG